MHRLTQSGYPSMDRHSEDQHMWGSKLNRHSTQYTSAISMVSQCVCWYLAEDQKRRSMRTHEPVACEGLFFTFLVSSIKHQESFHELLT